MRESHCLKPILSSGHTFAGLVGGSPRQPLARAGHRAGGKLPSICPSLVTAGKEDGGEGLGVLKTQYKPRFPRGLASSGMTLPPTTHTLAEAQLLRNRNKKTRNKKHTRKAPQFVILNQEWVARGEVSQQDNGNDERTKTKEAEAQQEQVAYPAL